MAHTDAAHAKAWNFWNGSWVEGNPGIMGPMSHGSWLSSTVFDGARCFEGTAPDLDLHCQRIVDSANAFGLKALHTADELVEIAKEGIAKFPSGAALYIKPMYWAESGWVAPDPEATRFCFNIFESPLPDQSGFSATVSPFRRPTLETAPTDVKAACHYPNAGRALREAAARGFHNALMLDTMGNVAEFATANAWLSKDGVVKTPVPNGSFLNGITRQRVIALLREQGTPVVECALSPGDFLEADEIFNTGNYGKLMPVIRFEDRDLQPGPVYRLARKLYWEFAHTAARL